MNPFIEAVVTATGVVYANEAEFKAAQAQLENKEKELDA